MSRPSTWPRDWVWRCGPYRVTPGDEGWRRCDIRRSRTVQPALTPDPGAGRPLDLLVQASDADDEELVEHPNAYTSIRYAFRLANEAARLRRPAEAVTWMRLIEMLQRHEVVISNACGKPSRGDCLRAIRDDVRLARQWAQLEEWASQIEDEDDGLDAPQDKD